MATLSHLQQELAELRRLRQHPILVKVFEVIEQQAGQRANHILLTPLESADMVFEQEYKKGEIQGMLLFVKSLENEIEANEALIEEHQRATAEDENGGTSDGN